MSLGNGEEYDEEEESNARAARWLEESSRLERLGREGSRRSICGQEGRTSDP